MNCSVSYLGKGRCPISPEAIERMVGRMLADLCLEHATVSVLLCDDPTIKKLNAKYRGKNRPTDVLSFSMLEGIALAGQGQILGDIIVSVPTAQRQAAARQVLVMREIGELLAHGLLHLLGFDHRTRFEERRMNAHAKRLIAGLSG
jgi:probable rRNA maturation factor